jgi:translation initiation factor 4E
MAMIGEQFPVDVLGAVASVRSQEDIISLWNRSGFDPDITHEICCRICEALELPADTRLEYKRHNESVRDGSSFRNTVIYQAGANEPFEVQQQPGQQGSKWGKK